MLNTKKMFTKILSTFAKTVGEPESVTFPFTATKSGILSVYVYPSNNSASYFYVLEDGKYVLMGSSTGGRYVATCPVVKGKTYTSTTSNVGTPRTEIFPIMGG